MKPADWKIMGYIGLALAVIFIASGVWIWLNVQNYMGWEGWLQYYQYSEYSLPLMILGAALFVFGYAFLWRAEQEAKSSQPNSANARA